MLESSPIQASGVSRQAWWGASWCRRASRPRGGDGGPAVQRGGLKRVCPRTGIVGGAEAAARKWSGPRRAEGRPCFVHSAEYPARPAGLGAAESGASALRVLSSGWRPRPATLGPALEALTARRLDWGVVSERGRGWRGRVRGPCRWVRSCIVGYPERPADSPFEAINSNIYSTNVYRAPVCLSQCQSLGYGP